MKIYFALNSLKYGNFTKALSCYFIMIWKMIPMTKLYKSKNIEFTMDNMKIFRKKNIFICMYWKQIPTAKDVIIVTEYLEFVDQQDFGILRHENVHFTETKNETKENQEHLAELEKHIESENVDLAVI